MASAGAETTAAEAAVNAATTTDAVLHGRVPEATCVRALLLLCRLLRNCCASQPAVQLALHAGGVLIAVSELIDATSTRSTPSTAAAASAAPAAATAECARAAAQFAANLSVGQPEAQRTLWRGASESLLPRLLESHTSPGLTTVGLMMLYNCVRAQPARLRALVRVSGTAEERGDGNDGDGNRGDGKGGDGKGGDGKGDDGETGDEAGEEYTGACSSMRVWLPACLHLLAALHLVDGDGVGGGGPHNPRGAAARCPPRRVT